MTSMAIFIAVVAAAAILGLMILAGEHKPVAGLSHQNMSGLVPIAT